MFCGYRGGSRPGKQANVDRRRGLFGSQLCQDYWGPTPVYSADMFRRNFHMPIGLFDELVVSVTAHDDYFAQKSYAAGSIGFTPLQKIAKAVRILISGVSSQELDDKYRISKSTAMESLKRFCSAMRSSMVNQLCATPTSMI
ncbi:Aste57867_17188 [Aphanomyces stellatus]|uniref:Aste57867_17188 protein n=1 Tax=Aphanomyces stellatus TaxID=120398 RepID=A0A485L771_9STRA|nr:hypothetical protein As57867_017129 [Aphanomyces stellatus]VFT93945.1 Aste57867_17188 [Aphanomyces stellatus]